MERVSPGRKGENKLPANSISDRFFYLYDSSNGDTGFLVKMRRH